MTSLAEEFRKTWLTTLIGIVLALGSTLLIFWNERRAVSDTLLLQEVRENAVTLNWERDFDKSAEGSLVHITGPIKTDEPLTQIDYNIIVQAVKLKRRVQMYQWVEETIEHKYGESLSSVETEDRTYFYSQEWKDTLIDSRSFYIRTGHENPQHFPFESQVLVAKSVGIGPYEIGNEAKGRFSTFIEVTSDSRPDDPSIKLHSGLYYHCNDVFNPEIGDVRIQFSFAGLEGEIYTVVGLLKNGQIVPYRGIGGKNSLLIVLKGAFNLQEAIKQEHNSQRKFSWTVRFVGFVFMFFALTCTNHYFYLFFQCFPRFVSFNSQSFVTSNVTLAFSFTLLITSIAWIIHRPLFGASLLCTAISPTLLKLFQSHPVAMRYHRIE